VAASFRAIARAEPERVRLVSASGTAEEVTQRLMAALQDMF
jgi:dTMP kinase